MIKGVIFDMDGVLIDSEPLWRRAEIETFKTVDIKLSEDQCNETMGLRVDEVVEYWFQRYPRESSLKKQLEEKILDKVIELIKKDGIAKEGVYEVLNFFSKQNVKLALASTSAMVLINVVLEKLNIKHYFEFIHSAEFEGYGKPNPSVYLTTAKQMGLQPSMCVAIEDSINGILAAKSARMECIAIPEKELLGDKRLGIADVVLSSLLQLDRDVWEKL